MSLPVDEVILSQLADGELAHDETIATLLAALDSEESRDRLRRHLQLRQMTSAWRSQTPSSDLTPALSRPAPTPLNSSANERLYKQRSHGANFLVASLAGGLLVALGVWVGKSSHVAPVEFHAGLAAQPEVV